MSSFSYFYLLEGLLLWQTQKSQFTTAKEMKKNSYKINAFPCFPASFCFFISLLHSVLPKAKECLSGCLSRLCLISRSANIPKWALNSSHPTVIALTCAHSANERGCSTSAEQCLDKSALYCVVHYKCILKSAVNTSNNSMHLLIVHSQMAVTFYISARNCNNQQWIKQ